MKTSSAHLSYRLVATIILLIVLVSCSKPAATPTIPPSITPVTPSPEAATALPAEINEIVQVGKYRMPVHCRGQGEPTIILENGDGFTPWSEASLKRFESLGRVCFYRRAGYLGELPEVRTVKDQVHDLHQLLSIIGEHSPYVLVGVSRAGLHLLVFTHEYPEEVAGLVFLEAQPPTFFSLLKERLGQEKPDDPDWIKEFRNDLTAGWVRSMEKIDILASVDQAMEVTSLGDRPMVVLVAGNEVVGGDEWEKIFANPQRKFQIALSQLSTS